MLLEANTEQNRLLAQRYGIRSILAGRASPGDTLHAEAERGEVIFTATR